MAKLVRVKVANPSGGRAMARKKRKKRSNPTKRRHRARRANPAKRRRRRSTVVVVRNPRRGRKRRHARATPRRAARRRARNPAPRKRRHRRNPGTPVWATAAMAAVLGLVGYAVANAGAYAVTQRMDPTLATVVRNRYILGGLVVVGGLVLATKNKPLLGAGLAAGGAAALAGTQLSLAVGNVIDLPTTPAAATAATPAAAAAAPAATTALATTTAAPATAATVGAVFAQNLRGLHMAMQGVRPQMGAVYAQNLRALGPAMGHVGLGAVYAQTMRGIGAAQTALPNPTGAPWAHAGPFGY